MRSASSTLSLCMITCVLALGVGCSSSERDRGGSGAAGAGAGVAGQEGGTPEGAGAGEEGEGEGAGEGGEAEGGGAEGAEGGAGADDGQDGGEPSGCDDRCDCGAPLVCNPEAPPNGECVASEEGCNGNADCPCATICRRGVCQDGCFANADCGDDGVCRAISEDKDACFQKCGEGFECPKADDGGLLFDCIDDACIPKVRQCTGCVDDSECGGPVDRCIDFGDTGSFCTQDCALDPNSCPDGFRCVDIQRENEAGQVAQFNQCVPRVGDCLSVCTFIGCDNPDEPHCNPVSGKCKASFRECDPCRSQAQCGELTCLEYPRQGQYHCLPPCPGGQRDCPDSGWRCDTQGPMPWCVPLNASCDRCLGKNCGALNPHCDPTSGQCVECLADLDCPDGQHCGADTHQCLVSRRPCDPDGAGGAEDLCLADEPFCFDQWCVSCLSDRDCQGDCDPEAEQGGNLVCHNFSCLGDNFCQVVECPESTLCVNAARQCVEGGRCESDSDCGDSRLCDQQRNECYNNNATCVHNGDCPQNLVCDLNLRLCKGCSDNSQCRRRQHCVPARDGSEDRVCIQS